MSEYYRDILASIEAIQMTKVNWCGADETQFTVIMKPRALRYQSIEICKAFSNALGLIKALEAEVKALKEKAEVIRIWNTRKETP